MFSAGSLLDAHAGSGLKVDIGIWLLELCKAGSEVKDIPEVAKSAGDNILSSVASGGTGVERCFTSAELATAARSR